VAKLLFENISDKSMTFFHESIFFFFAYAETTDKITICLFYVYFPTRIIYFLCINNQNRS